jgi:diaminohydroxyphosphoribosylaminopyrimidine deaminase/5-amino-6-(5-phosphoribosylamino)uracil reductase
LILDSWGKIPPSAGVFVNNDDRKTVRVGLAIGRRPATKPHPDCFDWYVNPDDRHQVDLEEVLTTAAGNNITSILVEGGGHVFGSFLRERLADKVHILIAPKFLGAGVNALGLYKAPSVLDAVRLIDASVRWMGQDLLITGYPDYEPESTTEGQTESDAEETDYGSEGDGELESAVDASELREISLTEIPPEN